MGEIADYYGAEDPTWMQEEFADLVQQPFKNDPPQPTKTIWVTREGQRIRVREMTDSHLVNTVRFLRRHAEPRKSAYEISLDRYMDGAPDGAWLAANSELTTLEDMDVDDYLESICPTFPAMLAEAEKRGLKP